MVSALKLALMSALMPALVPALMPLLMTRSLQTLVKSFVKILEIEPEHDDRGPIPTDLMAWTNQTTRVQAL